MLLYQGQETPARTGLRATTVLAVVVVAVVDVDIVVVVDVVVLRTGDPC